MSHLPTRVVATFIGASFAISGCATYAPVGAALTPGRATVRLSLTDAARAETIGALGSQVATLEGQVQSVSDSTVTVMVNEIGRVAADNQTIPAQTVAVPLRMIERADRRKILVGRSLLLAGAITGAVIWIGLQAGHGNVSYGRPTQPPPAGQ